MEKWDVGKLKNDGVKLEFERIMGDAVVEIGGEQTATEMWARIKQSIEGVAEEVIGRKGRRNRNDWFDDECRAECSTRKNATKRHSSQSE